MDQLCNRNFSPYPSIKISRKLSLYVFYKIQHNYSTRKGAPACSMTSKSYDLDLKKIAKISTTSREQHKQAPYPRLKNSKRTSKCQVFSFTVHEKPKKMDRVARPDPLARVPGALKRGETFEIVNIFVAVEGGAFEKKQIFEKKSQCRKTERGDPLGFFNIHSVVKYQRN